MLASKHTGREALKQLYLQLRPLALRLLVPVPAAAEMPRPLQSVLILSQRRLGDIALELPALRLLREQFPQLILGVVAPEAFQPLFQWACRPQWMADQPGTPAGMRDLASALRKRSWQAVVDLASDYHLAPARLAAASGAAVRLGFMNAGRERYFNRAVPLRDGESMADQFLRIIGELGVDDREPCSWPEIPSPPLPLPPLSSGQLRIGMHPGATHWTQRWPARHFGMLAERIVAGGDCCVVLGGRGEEAGVREVVQCAGGRAEAVCGDAGILGFAATLKQLDLLICNNSGPLHLAGLLGVPTLSFMGPTVRERWQPQGPRALVLRRDELPCIGCNRGYCRIGTHECLEGLTPDAAFDAFLQYRGSIPAK